MLRIYLSMILVISIFTQIDAQKKHLKTKDYKYQIGLNVTDVLSNFVNVSDNARSIDPFTLNLTKQGKKIKYRFGLKFIYKKNRVRLILNTQRKKHFIDSQIRLGFQKDIQVSKRFYVYWGLDLLFGLEDDLSESLVNNGILKNTEKTYSSGLGPVFGFEYRINSRFAISTSSSIYYVFSYAESKLSDSGVILDSSNGYRHEIEHLLPSSLYFHFSF